MYKKKFAIRVFRHWLGLKNI